MRCSFGTIKQFFKFIKLFRITDFLSKIMLRKYQRDLVPYFKKYQFTGLDDDRFSKLKVIGEHLSDATN